MHGEPGAMHIAGGKTTGVERRRPSICKPRRGVSRENTSVLDLQLPDLSENRFLLLKSRKSAVVCFGGLSRLIHHLHSSAAPAPHECVFV